MASKAKKKELQYQQQSMDEQHTKMMAYFDHNEKTTIPALYKELARCQDKKRIRTSAQQTTNNSIDENILLRNKISDIKKQIKILRAEKKTYLLQNARFLFHYYEENKKISLGVSEKVDIVHSFFQLQGKNNESSNLNNEKYNSAKYLYQSYWANMKQEHIKIEDYTISINKCPHCNIGEMISQEDEGRLICNNRKCGKSMVHIIENLGTVSKEQMNEATYTAYLRLNHFKEIISQFQGRETTFIPDDIIDMIRLRINKEMLDINKMYVEDMREILTTLNINKYFEHIQYINFKLGIKPPNMCDELIETLYILFIEIQGPWSKHCPPERNNFFNYYYLLYQLFVLLDQKQYLPYIVLFKNPQIQQQQDFIWEKICNDLDWIFFPTV